SKVIANLTRCRWKEPSNANPSFGRQRVTRVGNPALLKTFADPGAPFLHVVLHLFGRHLAQGVTGAAVDKEELGHRNAPLIVGTGWGRSRGLLYWHDERNRLARTAILQNSAPPSFVWSRRAIRPSRIPDAGKAGGFQ